ncbi:MAG: bifunctional UDP-sugar hydrolase/5'-nucleotidase [Minicystis sp.]
MRSIRSLIFVASAALFLVACREPVPIATPPLPRAPVELTLLFTSDEHGWIAPQIDQGMAKGGTADLLARLIRDEAHCPFLGDPRRCPDAHTILLSGGDNYTGPAISSYFGGTPMAEAMAAMGYAASALGNHELDFGRAQFVQNRARAHLLYLAANVRVTDPALASEMTLPGFALIERRGVKIGVVGLATEETLTTAMASRFDGVAIDPAEVALARVVPEAWAAGADAVVLIAHECPDKLAPILARHGDFQLTFALGAHCHRVEERRAGEVPVISSGWRLEHYVRLRLTIDPARARYARVLAAEPQVVEVRHDVSDGAVDAALAQRTAGWQTKLDQALGEEIGYAGRGLEKDADELARWLTTAMREELKTDVALLNTGGIRQALPKGPITKAALWSILPFDNKVMIVRVTGQDLITDLETEEAAFAGVTKQGGAYLMSDGKALDLKGIYSVATIDFLYYGGSMFRFQTQDRAPKETGLDWRAPIVAWTKRQKTTASAPLEDRLRAVGGKAPSTKPHAHAP